MASDWAPLSGRDRRSQRITKCSFQLELFPRSSLLPSPESRIRFGHLTDIGPQREGMRCKLARGPLGTANDKPERLKLG
jgi:hypothetical protein